MLLPRPLRKGLDWRRRPALHATPGVGGGPQVEVEAAEVGFHNPVYVQVSVAGVTVAAQAPGTPHGQEVPHPLLASPWCHPPPTGKRGTPHISM